MKFEEVANFTIALNEACNHSSYIAIDDLGNFIITKDKAKKLKTETIAEIAEKCLEKFNESSSLIYNENFKLFFTENDKNAEKKFKKNT